MPQDDQFLGQASELVIEHPSVEGDVVRDEARTVQPHRHFTGDVIEGRPVSDHRSRDPMDERCRNVAHRVHERVPHLDHHPVEIQRDQSEFDDQVGGIDAGRFGVDDDEPIRSTSKVFQPCCHVALLVCTHRVKRVLTTLRGRCSADRRPRPAAPRHGKLAHAVIAHGEARPCR